MSLSDQQELKKQLQKLLERKLIRPSSSPFASPCLFVDKKDGGKRLCIDYRRLNLQTITNQTSPPRIEDCLDALGSASYLSVIDLRSGYWQLRVNEGDVLKTAFTTPFGLYEWLVMPFGLKNAPAVFTRLLNHIFFSELNNFVKIFFDDIVVYSQNLETHRIHLNFVFDKLRTHKLYTKASKCKFGVPETKYLGHIVGSGTRRPDPAKVEAIRRWATPQNVKDVRSFMGFANYLHCTYGCQ
mmetsp:Transcript_14417/g.58400  ORF Transcript_14417/g.58400 Transcript_14417/m.58400 type:complete len:241 (-) Transcript_14417:1278-2000(-)